MKKDKNQPQQLTPAQFGEKAGGISPQAVMKKIHNTLINAAAGNTNKSNALPEDVTVEKFGRVYIIYVPAGFKFPASKEKKQALPTGKKNTARKKKK